VSRSVAELVAAVRALVECAHPEEERGQSTNPQTGETRIECRGCGAIFSKGGRPHLSLTRAEWLQPFALVRLAGTLAELHDDDVGDLPS